MSPKSKDQLANIISITQQQLEEVRSLNSNLLRQQETEGKENHRRAKDATVQERVRRALTRVDAALKEALLSQSYAKLLQGKWPMLYFEGSPGPKATLLLVRIDAPTERTYVVPILYIGIVDRTSPRIALLLGFSDRRELKEREPSSLPLLPIELEMELKLLSQAPFLATATVRAIEPK